jgi:hypothetical protein
LTENFEYALGSLNPSGVVLTIANNWSTVHTAAVPTTTNLIQVVSPSLSYSGYLSSGTGNAVKLKDNGQDLFRAWSISTNPTTIYYSFLVKITKLPSTTGAEFISLTNAGTGGASKSRIYVRASSSSNKINFGISQGTTVTWSTADYDVNTTYLLAASYGVVTGATNDPAALLINPSLNTTLPTSGWINATLEGSDMAFGLYAGVRLIQSTAPININALISGIRLSTSWADLVGTPKTAAPVLTAASSVNLGTGFDITFPEDGTWRTAITAVEVDGNVLAPAKYSVAAGKITINADAGLTIGSRRITIMATNYSPTAVFQTINPTVPAPTLTAATSAKADTEFDISFTDDALWRLAITDLKVGATALADSVYTISEGKITIKPWKSDLLKNGGTKIIDVIAPFYTKASVSQEITGLTTTSPNKMNREIKVWVNNMHQIVLEIDELSQNSELTIYDISGQKRLQQVITDKSVISEKLLQGIYLVQIQMNDSIWSEKVLVK